MKFIVSLICVILSIVHIESKLTEKFKWKELQYDWPSNEVREEAIKNGNYIEGHNLPLGLEVWKNKLFITVPRWRSGVAASLNYVDITDESSPVLHPYPSWEDNTLPNLKEDDKSNQLANNRSIISVFRVRADECDRLWVMDTGYADILGDGKTYSGPSLAIFNLHDDTLIRRFYIPKDLLKTETFFANVIVDAEKGDCDNAYAYLPDLGGYQVVVYSFKEDKSWRVKHHFFHFDPLQGDYNVGGVNFQWTDGVFSMAVGSKQKDGSRPIYFHAFSSTKEFVVSNKVLQNETESQNYNKYKLLGDRGSNSQSSASFYDKNTNVLFYTQVNKDSIQCWNTDKEYNEQTQDIVDSDSHTLVFPNDVKVDQEGRLWVLSDRMPIFIYKELKKNEENYRILMGKTEDLIKGTKCEAEEKSVRSTRNAPLRFHYRIQY